MLAKLKLIRETLEFIQTNRRDRSPPPPNRSECEKLYKSMAIFKSETGEEHRSNTPRKF